MNKSIIRSYQEFELFCKTKFLEARTFPSYNIIVNTSLEDVKKIIELCHKAILKDTQHSNFIYALVLSFSIKIKTIAELINIKSLFPQIMENIFYKIELDIKLTLCEKQSLDILRTAQYDVYEHLSTIFSNVNYRVTFSSLYDKDNIIVNNKNVNNIVKHFDKTLNNNKTFIVNLDFINTSFDISLLHKCILICSKYKKRCNGFIINIPNGDLYRVRTFVSNILCESVFVICGNKLIIQTQSSIGKLPPAIYIENVSDLMFFQKPLKKEIWDMLTENTYTSDKGTDELSADAKFFDDSFECDEKFWPCLQMCKKFLFEEFDDNSSVEYTKLRIAAYSNDEFYNDYVSKIPFLSLFIFSIYDNFYRSNLLLRFKKECGRKNYHLSIEDFVLSKQGNQKNEIYKIYEKTKNDYDIKNLLTFYHINKSGKPVIKLHKTVIAEIFECISISEGILQILENAVLHAQSGLLSLRVYSRAKGIETQIAKKEKHIDYLDSVYSERYFQYQNADFYLEVYLSDISDKSIPKKFIENIELDDQSFSELLESLSWSKKQFDDLKKHFNTKYFFTNNINNIVNFMSSTNDTQLESTRNELKKFKQKYYQIDKNLVHHYGLEIFNSIITSRVGIFSVCGHSEAFDNLDDVFDKVYADIETFAENGHNNITPFMTEYKSELQQKIKLSKKVDIDTVRGNIQNDKEFSGTSYRILFPLNHSSVMSENFLELSEENYKMTEDEWVPISLNKHIQPSAIKEVHDKQKSINDITCFIRDNWLDIEVKKRIQQFKQKNITLDNKVFVLCINYPEIFQNSENTGEHFEEFIKAILLFALDALRKGPLKNLPIAIVNLDPFQLIEASRIISIYYAKNSINAEEIFSKMPIYLKCKNSSKEVIFSGNNIKEVENNIIKTAMKNGTMFDELATIVEILKRISHENRGDI